MEEYKQRTMWGISWFVEVPEGVIEDTDFLLAYSEQDAVEKWLKIDDIPDGAQIVSVQEEEVW